MGLSKYRLVVGGCLLLLGCSSSRHSTDDIDKYKYSIGYGLMGELKSKGCPDADGMIFYADNSLSSNKRITTELHGTTCKLLAESYVKNICKGAGGVWETHFDKWTPQYGQAFCTKNDGLLFVWFQYDNNLYGMNEPLKGREDDWLEYVRLETGFETSAHKKQRLQNEKVNDDNFRRRYALYLKGEPAKVMKSNIGTRICRLDEKTASLVASGTQRAFYSGFIENKSGGKLQIRYESYFNVAGVSREDLIRWEKPGNWFICEDDMTSRLFK